MRQFVTRRIAGAAVMLLVATSCVFVAVRVAPGDVCSRILGTNPEPGQCDAINKELGLNQSPIHQYLSYISGVVSGDLGTSLYRHTDVAGDIRERLPLTAELAMLSLVFALIAGLPSGIWSAVYSRTPGDYVVRVLTILALSMPSFWVATFAIVLPAQWWGYASPPGYAAIWHNPAVNLQQLALPSIALGLFSAAAVARMTRSCMLEVLREDYVRTARAKGLSNRSVYLGHALRNALSPVLTLVAVQFAALLGGTVVIESIFGLPGIGSLTVQAILQKDYPVVQGIVVVSAGLVLGVNFITDVSYAWLDPRIKLAS